MAIVVVALLCCSPIGLVLTWINKKWTTTTKWIITAVIAALWILGAIAGAAGGANSDDAISTSKATTTTEAKATTTTESKASTTTGAPTTTKAPTTTTTAAPTTTTTTAPPLTKAQANAVRSAERYLDFTAFSRAGLISQLSSEYGDQFSVEDATFAVDSLNVDWNEQAAKAAQKYLDFSSFSRNGLIQQLESEYGDQFTHEQAVYGVDAAGL